MVDQLNSLRLKFETPVLGMSITNVVACVQQLVIQHPYHSFRTCTLPNEVVLAWQKDHRPTHHGYLRGFSPPQVPEHQVARLGDAVFAAEDTCGNTNCLDEFCTDNTTQRHRRRALRGRNRGPYTWEWGGSNRHRRYRVPCVWSLNSLLCHVDRESLFTEASTMVPEISVLWF